MGGSSSHPMAVPTGACKCLHCGTIFFPDPRNRHHQRFCSQPACRQASKRESQRRWVARPENRDYFRGPDQAARVQAWRRAHPGYWRRRSPKAPDALQDLCPKQPPPPQSVATSEISDLSGPALQDLCQAQLPLMLGLISQIVDSPLQEDILPVARRLIAKGQDLLDHPAGRPRSPTPGSHDLQTPPSPGPPPRGPLPVQLG